MTKSKRSQLTGEEETLCESVARLLLCCWGPRGAVVGGMAGAGYAAEVAACYFGVARGGHRVEARQGEWRGVQTGLCSTPAPVLFQKEASLPEVHVRGRHVGSLNISVTFSC